MASRLETAIGTGLNVAEARIVVIEPSADYDLTPLMGADVQIISAMKPIHDRFASKGLDCHTDLNQNYDIALICLPRAKALARDLIARAAENVGMIIIDSPKTDGVESVLKDIKKRTTVKGVISKAHGKLFWFTTDIDLSDWIAPDAQMIEGGYRTHAGVFSADGIDPASKLLSGQLTHLKGRVADLGGGWGYLTAQVMDCDLSDLYLIEADHRALTCAKTNITDPRVHFLWQNALTWQSPALLDHVIMNPPFHTGRAAEPQLGQGFIETAVQNLAPRGQLWMVANRHLPYEPTLDAQFKEWSEIAGDNRFKVLHAAKPYRNRR